jgi:hypothetical protein
MDKDTVEAILVTSDSNKEAAEEIANKIAGSIKQQYINGFNEGEKTYAARENTLRNRIILATKCGALAAVIFLIAFLVTRIVDNSIKNGKVEAEAEVVNHNRAKEYCSQGDETWCMSYVHYYKGVPDTKSLFLTLYYYKMNKPLRGFENDIYYKAAETPYNITYVNNTLTLKYKSKTYVLDDKSISITEDSK